MRRLALSAAVVCLACTLLVAGCGENNSSPTIERSALLVSMHEDEELPAAAGEFYDRISAARRASTSPIDRSPPEEVGGLYLVHVRSNDSHGALLLKRDGGFEQLVEAGLGSRVERYGTGKWESRDGRLILRSDPHPLWPIGETVYTIEEEGLCQLVEQMNVMTRKMEREPCDSPNAVVYKWHSPE